MKTVRYAPVHGMTHTQVPAVAPYMKNSSQVCDKCRDTQSADARPIKGGFHVGDEVELEDDVAAKLLGGTIEILGEKVTFAPNPNFVEVTAKSAPATSSKPAASRAPASEES